MAKLVFGLTQSLDGYVDHMLIGPPMPSLFRHFMEWQRSLAGTVYGRRTYEIMQYWDEDQPDWDAGDHEFAAAWRKMPKWVVSRSLKSVGHNATLISDDVEPAVRALKSQHAGEIATAGPNLARSLTGWGLIDEYRLYFLPCVLGGGTPFFAGPRPRLRLVANEVIGEGAALLRYVPAGP
jgi:dihydrofolate reductase